jgi:hypothetical protein
MFFKNPKPGGSYDFEIIKELEVHKLSKKKKNNKNNARFFKF